MNIQKRHIFLAVVAVVLSIQMSQPVRAEKVLTPGSYLVEIGRLELDKGRAVQAIHEFKKALLVEPYNEEAIEELRRLGVTDGGYQGAKTTSQRLREYQEKVAMLEQDKSDMENRLQKVQQQQDRLHEMYVLKNLELEVLINKVTALKTLREHDQKKQFKQIKQVAEYYSDQTKDLKKTVAQQKKDIVNQHIALLMPNERTGINISDVEDSLLNLGYRVNHLDPMTQAKMEIQDQLIKTFTEYLELRESRFLEVENQLVFNEIDKAKYEKMLVKKMDEIIKLQDNVDRSLNRLADRDRLIAEQMEEKKLLESELLEVQPNSSM